MAQFFFRSSHNFKTSKSPKTWSLFDKPCMYYVPNLLSYTLKWHTTTKVMIPCTNTQKPTNLTSLIILSHKKNWLGRNCKEGRLGQFIKSILKFEFQVAHFKLSKILATSQKCIFQFIFSSYQQSQTKHGTFKKNRVL